MSAVTVIQFKDGIFERYQGLRIYSGESKFSYDKPYTVLAVEMGDDTTHGLVYDDEDELVWVPLHYTKPWRVPFRVNYSY